MNMICQQADFSVLPEEARFHVLHFEFVQVLTVLHLFWF